MKLGLGTGVAAACILVAMGSTSLLAPNHRLSPSLPDPDDAKSGATESPPVPTPTPGTAIEPTSTASAQPQPEQPQSAPPPPRRAVPVFAPPSLDFGEFVPTQHRIGRHVTLSNTGNAPLQIQGFSVTNGKGKGKGKKRLKRRATAAFAPVSGKCRGTLAAGESCALSVVFTPRNAGRQGTTVKLNANVPASFEVSAMPKPAVKLLPDPVTFTRVSTVKATDTAARAPGNLFGSVTTTIPRQQVTLTNGSVLTLTNVKATAVNKSNIGGRSAFQVDTSQCRTLALRESCKLTVSMSASNEVIKSTKPLEGVLTVTATPTVKTAVRLSLPVPSPPPKPN